MDECNVCELYASVGSYAFKSEHLSYDILPFFFGESYFQRHVNGYYDWFIK